MAIEFVIAGGNGSTFVPQRQDGDYFFLYLYHWSSTFVSWNRTGWTKMRSYDGSDTAELWGLQWHSGMTFSTTLNFFGSPLTGQSAPGVFIILMRGLTDFPWLKSDIYFNGTAGDAYCPAVTDENITPGDMGLICSIAKGGAGIDWGNPSIPLRGDLFVQQTTANNEMIFRAVDCQFGFSPSVLFPNTPSDPNQRRNAMTMQFILPGTSQAPPAPTTTGGRWWKWKAPQDGVLALDSLYSDPPEGSRDGTTYLFVFKGDENGGNLELVARYTYPMNGMGTHFQPGVATQVNATVKAGQTYYIKATLDPTGVS